MKTIFKKLKGYWGSAIVSLLSLIFASGVKSQSAPMVKYGMPPAGPLYGVVPPMPVIAYGVTPMPPDRILFSLLPYIGGVFLIFVAAPVLGLIWYRKRGGKKKWPSVIVWTLAVIFVILLAALIILLYSDKLGLPSFY